MRRSIAKGNGIVTIVGIDDTCERRGADAGAGNRIGIVGTGRTAGLLDVAVGTRTGVERNIANGCTNTSSRQSGLRNRNEVVVRNIAVIIAVERDRGVVLNGRNRSSQALHGNGISGGIILAADIKRCRHGVAAAGVAWNRQRVGRGLAVRRNLPRAKGRAGAGRDSPVYIAKSAVNLIAALIRKRKGKIDRRTARCRNVRIIGENVCVLGDGKRRSLRLDRVCRGRRTALLQEAGDGIRPGSIIPCNIIGDNPFIAARLILGNGHGNVLAVRSSGLVVPRKVCAVALCCSEGEGKLCAGHCAGLICGKRCSANLCSCDGNGNFFNRTFNVFIFDFNLKTAVFKFGIAVCRNDRIVSSRRDAPLRSIGQVVGFGTVIVDSNIAALRLGVRSVVESHACKSSRAVIDGDRRRSHSGGSLIIIIRQSKFA